MHPILLPRRARIGLRYVRKRSYGKCKDEFLNEAVGFCLEAERGLYGNLLNRAVSSAPRVTVKELAEAFSVFHEWKFLGRADKRQLLWAAMPEVHVQDYRVVGLSLFPGLPSSGDVSRTGGDSWPRPA
jgi:hypothetical protein